MTTPDNVDVVHKLDDTPSWGSAFLLGLQHVVKFSSLMFAATIIIKLAGLTGTQAINTLAWTMIASAISTVFFALKRPLGAGCFLSSTISVPFYGVIILAAKLGGMPLVITTAIIGGLLQILLTPLLCVKRLVFTKSVASFVIIMSGIWVALLGIHEMFYASDYGQLLLHGKLMANRTAHFHSIFVGCVTFAFMILFSLRSANNKRLYSILSSTLLGIVCAWLLHFYHPGVMAGKQITDWFRLPAWQFDFSLHWRHDFWVPVIIAAVVNLLQIFGSIIVIQCYLDKHYEIDLHQVKRGNMAVGAGIIVSGLLGSVPCGPNVGGLGIMMRAGSFARRSAFTYAVILILLACCPVLISCLLAVPAAINGAVLLFIGSAMLTAGLRIINFNALNAIEMSLFSLALLLGVGCISIPELYHNNYFWNYGVTDPAFLVAIMLFIIFNFLVNLIQGRRQTHAG